MKTAYRKLAMKWHPDKHEGPEKENATHRFQEVSAAYQKLTTSEEDSIEIEDFQDAFQFFMRIFMAHCQDECFFDDDLEYEDDLPYTSEEYYDSSEYSDENGPLDYQYLREEKPPGFARTAEEALKNAEELIREEAEQKRRLEKKKTKNKRKRTKNRKKKQANKIKTTEEDPLIPEPPKDKLLPPPVSPPPPAAPAKTTPTLGNGDIKPPPNTAKSATLPNGKISSSLPSNLQQTKQATKKQTSQTKHDPIAPHKQTSHSSKPQKQTPSKQEAHKRNSLQEDTPHRESHNHSAFVTVSRRKKKAASTSGLTSNGSLPQCPAPLPHKTHLNGTSQSKPPPCPPPAPSKPQEHPHPVPSPSAIPPAPQPIQKPPPKETLRPNSISPELRVASRPNPPLHNPFCQDLPHRSSEPLQQFNPIFNPMPSPYVEPYSEDCGHMSNTAHVDEAIHLAEQGNEFASREQFTIAIERFTSAIFYNPKEYRYYGNRSLCYERLADFEIALSDSDKAIELRPDWPKAYFRRARALRGLKRFSEAEEALSIVQSLQGVSEDLEIELKLVRGLQLQEFGFTASQSEKAMKRCNTYQQAIDLLIHGQISDSDDEVYHTDEEGEGYKRMFENPSWPMASHYQPFQSQGAQHPLSKHPHSTSSVQGGTLRQVGMNEESGTVASLWVGNIDVHMTEKELSDLFSGIGRIQSVYFLPKIQGKNRAAFVNFTRSDDAANAINSLQGVEKYGKCLLLRYPDNPKPPESLPGGKVTCKFWLQGRCVRGNKCAFVHPRKSK